MQALLASIQGQTLSVMASTSCDNLPRERFSGLERCGIQRLLRAKRWRQLVFTGQVDPAGKLLATRIWSNIVNILGSVIDISANGFQIAASKAKTNVTATAQVTWRADTVINENQMNSRDIRVGMSAQVIGLFAGNGSVQATRIWLHDSSGYPIGWQGEAVLSPYAQVR